MGKSHNAEKASASVALLIHRVLAVYVGIHGALFCALAVWGILSFVFPGVQVRISGLPLLVIPLAGIFMVLTPFQAFKTPEEANKTALVLGCLISLFVDGLYLTMFF